jgi:hypothetical protein
MGLDELVAWRKKFLDIRYKYFGHCHKKLFKLPNGYIRCSDGVVRSEKTKKTSENIVTS